MAERRNTCDVPDIELCQTSKLIRIFREEVVTGFLFFIVLIRACGRGSCGAAAHSAAEI